MKHTTFISAILFTGFFSINAMAQVKSNNKSTTVNNAGSKAEAKLGQVDSLSAKQKRLLQNLKKSPKILSAFSDQKLRMKVPS